MTDPELKYCPECNDEYRAEIETCAVCCVDLITGLQKIKMEKARQQKLAARNMDLSPDDDLVTMRMGQLRELRHLVELLHKEKIATAMIGDMSSCGKDRFGNTLPVPTTYTLLVKRENAREAFLIIETEHRRLTALEQHDNSNVDAVFNPEKSEAKCPACGHSFPTTEKACPDCGLAFE